MLTVAQVQSLLSRYAGVGFTTGSAFLERLNLVRARLLEDGAWSSMMPRISLTVYTDYEGKSIVTLPRQYLAVLRGYAAPVDATNALCFGMPMGTSGVFNEGLIGQQGYGSIWGGTFNYNFQECPDYYCVYREWTEPKLIRMKFEVAEAAGTIYLSGFDDGAAIWVTNSGTWENREAVAYVGAGAVTSTKMYDAKGFGLIKPVTLGRVFAYTVDTDGTETLVAVYDNVETIPQWRRYRVPCVCTVTQDYLYVAVVKLGYVPLVNQYDEVVPNNIGALKLGFDAMLAEDARNYTESETCWESARARLVRQSEGESEGTQDHIQIEDDWNISALNYGGGYGF